jgi:hypothetical protein
MNDLHYPVGKFQFEEPLTEQQKRTSLDNIAGR